MHVIAGQGLRLINVIALDQHRAAKAAAAATAPEQLAHIRAGLAAHCQTR